MRGVKLNVLANLSGSAWSALMAIAFIPAYIKLMGVEAYALVGVFISLQATFAILDLGLSQTLSRELARLGGSAESHQRMIDTAKTLECLYWVGSVAIIVVVLSLSYYISHHWLTPKSIDQGIITRALMLMAVIMGLRWPVTLYTGGLNGLQRQVLLNSIVIFFATFQNVGALIALLFIKPTIEVYFYWQLVVAITQVVFMKLALWHCLPSGKGRFSNDVLSDVWRFALGMTGIAALSTILTQLDKIILSRILDLQEFGYYVFASTIAAAIFKLVGPFFNAYLPRFSQIISAGDSEELSRTYNQGCQLIALFVIPIALILSVFSTPILLLWTGDSSLVEKSALIFSLLVIGNTVNGLMTIPYVFQIAHGWTKFALYQNLGAVLFFVPFLWVVTNKWGGLGAASSWVFLNVMLFLVNIHMMYKWLLKESKIHWYRDAVIFPVMAGLFGVSIAYGCMAFSGALFFDLARLFVSLLMCVIFVAFALPAIRRWSLDKISEKFEGK